MAVKAEERDAQKDLAMCEAATRGPWEWVRSKFRDGYSGIEGPDGNEVLYPDHCNESDYGAAWFDEYPTEADGKFMVESRTALPYWINRCLDAERALETLYDASRGAV